MRKRSMIAVLLAAVLIVGIVPVTALAGEQAEPAEQTQIINLKTMDRVNPLGVDTVQPTFSWQMRSDAIGAAQSSYRIVVTDPDGEEVWDSGVVESAASNGILYEGETLKPATRYTWQLQVVDQDGEDLAPQEAWFETSLLDETLDSWHGAQWIGTGELPLDAASKAIFHIRADVQIPKGSQTASFILGADDFRLRNEVFNVDRRQGENYVRAELDISGAATDGGAKINVYRCGYYEGDDPQQPFYVIEENENLDSVLTADNAYDTHQMDIFCAASTLTFTIDGVEIDDKVLVGASSDTNTFPNLNSVGFAARAGEQATFTDYCITNGGSYTSAVLLDQETGATYQIFEDLDGVEVDGNMITVDGGEQGRIVYADPTYGAMPMLRTAFQVRDDVKQARLYLTAHGIYDFYLNGEEVAPEEWFHPGSTEYDQILAYNIVDVTDHLTAGENAMGAILGEGWWTGMATFESMNNNYYGDETSLMAMLVIDYADGSQDVVVTDPDTWTCYTDGPVRCASFFQGERYDATREAAIDGWTQAGFDDSDWRAAAVAEIRKPFANPKLVTRYDEPVHVIRTVTAAEFLGETREGSGSWLYDMGENVAGVPLITIPDGYAQPGDEITIRVAEILYPELEEYLDKGIDGMLMVENYRTALSTDFYTVKEGENVIAPDLTFHGYRYIELTGLSEPLPAENVQMQVLSSMDVTSTYESSNELVNRLYRNISNSMTSNYISIPTDCPQRDERMGWTGDAQVFALSASYLADTYPFMRQWMDTVRADSNEEGLSAQFCPAFNEYDPLLDDAVAHDGKNFGITWNCLIVTIPYAIYLQTGNLEIVQDNLQNIYAYMDMLAQNPFTYKNADGEKLEESRLTGKTGTLCDHLSRILTDAAMLGNAQYIGCLDKTAYLADAVQDTEKAQEYRNRAAAARDAWNELYVDPNTGKTRKTNGDLIDTQASYATPLRFNVFSEENLPKVLPNYEASIIQPDVTDNDGLDVPAYSITTGFNATGNVLHALSEHGLNDTAYKLFESTEYASWLYPVTQGATSIWERWNSFTWELGFNGNNSMNSFNHYSFGAVYEWMMAYHLGISADPQQPGYQHILLQPVPGGSFTYAKGSFESVYGTIESGWTADQGIMTAYDVTIPANTTATLYLPMEGEVADAPGITVTGIATHHEIPVIQLELASGTYHFHQEDGTVQVEVQ